tara:strand:+ start:22 stop:477 length:456 start_codon:yes stop_codon:yes gene_type:complete
MNHKFDSRRLLEGESSGSDTPSKKEWIEKHHPKNGLFRVYWKDVESLNHGGVSFKDEGEGLRWEWYYKDGKQDGVAKGWYPDGQIRSEINYKDGKEDGVYTYWYNNGQKMDEYNFKDGIHIGLRTTWKENGQKDREITYKGGFPIKKRKFA